MRGVLLYLFAKPLASHVSVCEEICITRETERKINHFSEKINREAGPILPARLKIRWIGKDTVKAILGKGVIIIRAHRWTKHGQNFLNAALIYLQGGMLPQCRKYLDSKLTKAIELVLMERLLRETASKDELRLFMINVLIPQFDLDEELKNYCALLRALDEMGLFTRIMLRELFRIEKLAGEKLPLPKELKAETKELVSFLDQIRSKLIFSWGRLDRLSVFGEIIRLSIMFVDIRLATFDDDRYIKRAKVCLASGARTIYVIGRGGNNTDLSRDLGNELENRMPLKITYEDYFTFRTIEGRDRTGICIALESASEHPQIERIDMHPIERKSNHIGTTHTPWAV